MDPSRKKSIIAVIGTMAQHKGANFFLDICKTAEALDSPLEFRLFGESDGRFQILSPDFFNETGRYENERLLEMLAEVNPSLIFFPGKWPETFSYTLSQALRFGSPIVAPAIGAFSERLVGNARAILFDINETPTGVHDLLLAAAAGKFPQPTQARVKATGSEFRRSYPDAFYKDEFGYLRTKGAEARSIRTGIHALVVVERLSGGEASPCAYIRLIEPLARMIQNAPFMTYQIGTAEQALEEDYDVLLFHRYAVPNAKLIEQVINAAKSRDAKIIYDIDDDLLEIPADHPEFAVLSGRRASVLKCLAEADSVWASTDVLRQRVMDFANDVVVLPNAIHPGLVYSTEPRLLQVSEGSARTRILLMGTRTHDSDYRMIEPALRRICQKYRDHVEIVVVGMLSRPQTFAPITVLTAAPTGKPMTYPMFMRWLAEAGPFDIGLAPLRDIPFNACKSDIKYWDYALLGAAPIVSRNPAYAGTVEDGVDGLLVDSNPIAWADAIDRLIQDRNLRRRIQTAAMARMMDLERIGAIDTARLNNLMQLRDRKERRGRSYRIRSAEAAAIDRGALAQKFLVGSGIEVGALHNPLRVPPQVKVRYVDRLDKHGLYRHYPELKQFDLVDVDILDNGEQLSSFADGSQDFIIANHFLEHCEDPIGTIISFTRVLRTAGVIYLAVPNKRMTFDRDRPLTQFDHLRRDHDFGAEGSRWKHFLEWVEHVEPHFGRRFADKHGIEERVKDLHKQNYSIHFHCWTPDSFAEFLDLAFETYTIPLEIMEFWTHNSEMIVIAKKRADPAKVN